MRTRALTESAIIISNMYNYELLPKLTHMTLYGLDEDGKLNFLGTIENWNKATKMEEEMTDTITKAKNF